MHCCVHNPGKFSFWIFLFNTEQWENTWDRTILFIITLFIKPPIVRSGDPGYIDLLAHNCIRCASSCVLYEFLDWDDRDWWDEIEKFIMEGLILAHFVNDELQSGSILLRVDSSVDVHSDVQLSEGLLEKRKTTVKGREGSRLVGWAEEGFVRVKCVESQWENGGEWGGDGRCGGKRRHFLEGREELTSGWHRFLKNIIIFFESNERLDEKDDKFLEEKWQG